MQIVPHNKWLRSFSFIVAHRPLVQLQSQNRHVSPEPVVYFRTTLRAPAFYWHMFSALTFSSLPQTALFITYPSGRYFEHLFPRNYKISDCFPTQEFSQNSEEIRGEIRGQPWLWCRTKMTDKLVLCSTWYRRSKIPA